MNIMELYKILKRPPLYEKGTGTMWTDEYISRQLLSLHLNENLDLASRKRSTINQTIEWILSKTGKEKMNILDLGCGPGLYTEELALKGHNLTGIDISRNSIEYAVKSAEEKGLNIKYINDSYLNLNFTERFDLVILIYTDFGVLHPDEQERLLKLIRTALKPGGIFIFDVLNDSNISEKAVQPNWEIVPSGFWKDTPYLALSNSYLYEEEKVLLTQHLIIDDKDENTLYRFWIHFYNDEMISSLLIRNHFNDIELSRSVIPGNDKWSGENVTFCIAVKN